MRERGISLKPNRLRNNHFGTAELQWPACLGEQNRTPQASHARQAGRARRTRVRGPKFEVFGTSNPERRTFDFASLSLHASRLIVYAVFALTVIAGEWSFCVERSQAIQEESQAEKEANLKGQAQGGLFNRWTFDQQKSGEVPAGFSMLGFGEGAAADWTIKEANDAPSASNVLGVKSSCQAVACYRLIVADGLQYEYPDVSVRMRFPIDAQAGGGGVVFGVQDGTSFYAAVVDLAAKTIEVIRVVDGKELSLGRRSITPKAVPWHTLRIQRNTIISKDFIETYFDGQLVVAVQDQALATGQVGLLVRGQTALDFDSLHAIPLFSQRPFSAPAAY